MGNSRGGGGGGPMDNWKVGGGKLDASVTKPIQLELPLSPLVLYLKRFRSKGGL